MENTTNRRFVEDNYSGENRYFAEIFIDIIKVKLTEGIPLESISFGIVSIGGIGDNNRSTGVLPSVF